MKEKRYKWLKRLLIARLKVSDAVTAWLGQSVKLAAAGSSAMEEEQGNSKYCGLHGFPWRQLWSLCPSVK